MNCEMLLPYEKFDYLLIQLLKLELPKLPVRFKDGNAVEVTEKQEVASTSQVILFNR